MANDPLSPNIEHAGLPNIGNTCFLNSVIQLLNAATLFRDQLIRKCEKGEIQLEQYKEAYLLAKLFKILRDGDGSREKSKEKLSLLKELVICVEEFNLSYKKNYQEDAFETLLNLLQKIKPLFQDKFAFQMQYSFTCKCKGPKSTLAPLFCPNEDQKCATCKEVFNKKYEIFPKYLIVVNSKSLVLQLKQLNEQKYKLLSRVEYTGNRKSGHYTCVRKQGNTEYLISDSSVKPVKAKNQKEEQSVGLLIAQAFLFFVLFPITYPYFMYLWAGKKYSNGTSCIEIAFYAVGMTAVLPITHIYFIYMFIGDKVQEPHPQLSRILLYEMADVVQKK